MILSSKGSFYFLHSRQNNLRMLKKTFLFELGSFNFNYNALLTIISILIFLHKVYDN